MYHIFYAIVALQGLLWLARKHQHFTSMVALLLVAHTGALASTIYLDVSQVFITEQARWSYKSNAAGTLLLYDLLLFGSALLVWRLLGPVKRGVRSGRRAPRPSRQLSRALIIGGIAFACFHSLNILLSGSPLFMGMNRYFFWSTYSTLPVARWIWAQGAMLSLALGMVFSAARHGKLTPFYSRMSLALHVAFVAINLLYGDKFSWLVQLIYWFWLPSVIDQMANRSSWRLLDWKVALRGLGVAGLIVGLLFVHYRSQAVAQNRTVLNLIVDRALALQGHVWWAVHEKVFRYGIQGNDQLTTELEGSLGLNQPGEETGMSFMMRLVGDPDLVTRYLSYGINFTMAYPAIGVYVLGPTFGGLIQMVFGALLAFSAAHLYRKIVRGQVVRALIAYRIYFLVYFFLVAGELGALVSTSMLVYLVVALLAEFVHPTHFRVSERRGRAQPSRNTLKARESAPSY